MHFDVIIGNPPYQMATAGDANGAQAKPIYQLFVEHAIKLEPRYITMITPSRWFAGGWGLDEFREHMRTSNHMRIIHDFPSARDCFSGVEIKGGVNYFLWDREWNGECIFVTHQQGNVLSQMSRPLAEKGCEAIIRYNEAIPILRKIRAKTNATFDEFVSAMKPFGLPTTFRGTASKGIKVFAFRREEWVAERDIPKNSEMVWQHKLFVPKAVGTGDPKTDWIHAVYAPPGTCCTETYLTIGPFKSEKEALNCTTYIETRFFHFLVTLQKHTQDCLRRVYSFVPMQDFTKPWTDEELYVKYGLTADEIAFIKSLIRPMEAGE